MAVTVATSIPYRGAPWRRRGGALCCVAAEFADERAAVPASRLHVSMSRVHVSLVVASFLAAPCAAQTVGGRVFDARSRVPARQMEVQVLSDSGTVLARATTDSSGVFYATLAQPAHVRLRFAIPYATAFVSDTLTLGADEFVQREFAIDAARSRRPPDEEIIITEAVPLPGNPRLEYPADLAEAKAEAKLVVSFEVDTTGAALMGTFRVESATDYGFVGVVRRNVAASRYRSAEVNGRKVRMRVVQPFIFTLK
jgi:hypothetical protein